jgi:hypothetical protein
MLTFFSKNFLPERESEKDKQNALVNIYNIWTLIIKFLAQLRRLYILLLDVHN